VVFREKSYLQAFLNARPCNVAAITDRELDMYALCLLRARLVGLERTEPLIVTWKTIGNG
jgi:hypothetical protein